MTSDFPQTPDPRLLKAIELEKAKVRVEPYGDKVLAKTFSQRISGLFSGSAIGLVCGALVGAVSLYLLPLVGVQVAATGLLPLAQFALAGMGIGALAGASAGASAGAVAAAAEERERREKAQGLEAQILANPRLQQQLIDKYADAELLPDLPADSFKEVVERARGKDTVMGQMINLKTMAAATAMFAGIGALLGFTGDMPMLDMAGTDTGSRVLFGAGVTGAMGSLFGVNVPVVFTSLSDLSNDLLTGRLFSEQKTRQPELAPELVSELERPPISKTSGDRLSELQARGFNPVAHAPRQAAHAGVPGNCCLAEACHQGRLVSCVDMRIGA